MALFDIADSLGSQSNEDIGTYLTLINDFVTAQDFIGANVAGQGGIFTTKAWKHNGSVFGFINDTPDPTNNLFTILNASAIQPDTNLIGQSVKISLDCFYVHSYPGFGAHNVLFDFGGKSQINTVIEDVRHPLKFRINDQATASINGTPIFLGLNVSQNGISFEGRTINVDSSDDQQIISLFESNVFKTGLTLTNTAQPILKPYSALAVAAVTAIAARSKNVQVHNFNLGLDFSNSPTSCKLRHGSYLVIQSDDRMDLSNYRWNRTTARLEHFSGPNTSIEFNYLIISVSAYHP
jgi:hypothetical protein